MAAKPPFKASQDEIKALIDAAWKENGLTDRKGLAEVLGLSESAIYGYINRCEIPYRVYQQIIQLSAARAPSTAVGPKLPLDLSHATIDDLVGELRNRGFKVDLKSV